MKKVIILIAISLFSVVISLADDLLPIISRNRVGYINPNGDIVIATTLDTDVEWAKETFRGEKYKYPKFPQNAYFSEGLAVAKIKDRFLGFTVSSWYILINKDGKIVRDRINPHISPYHEGIAVAESDRPKGFNDFDKIKYSYIDLQGVHLSQSQLLFAGEFYDGKAMILKDTLFGYINKKMDWVIEPQYQLASHFSEGLAPASKGKLYGYINEKGEFVLPEKYEQADQFYSGLAMVYDNGSLNYINKKGEIVNKHAFQRTFRFSNNRALVEFQDAYGYIGLDGEFAIKPQYEAGETFSEGLAAVCKDGKWGFIDENNNFVIKPTYDYVKSFQSGGALVFKDGRLYYINKSGKTIYTF